MVATPDCPADNQALQLALFFIRDVGNKPKKMNLGKVTLFTFAFILFNELIAIWVFLELWFNIGPFIDNYYLLVNGSIEIALLAAFIAYMDGLDGIKPKRTSINYYLLALLSGLLLVLAQYPLFQLYNALFGTDINIVLDFDLARLKTVNILAIVFLIPIAEEFFFRQFIQRKLQLTFTRFNSVLLSAVLFSLVHLNIGAIFFEYLKFCFDDAYIALFGGIISGTLYSRSNSVGPSILFHMAWNFVAFAA